MRATASLLALSSLALSVRAQECRTDALDADTQAFIEGLQQKERISSDSSLLTRRQTGNITVPVHMHLAASSEREGEVPDSRVQSQFAVLAAAYEPLGIHLTLESTTSTVDPIIAQGPFGPGEDHQDWLRSTRQGDYATLNVYIYTDMDPGISGFCPMPAIGGDQDPYIWNDGCHLLASTLPDGADDEEGLKLGATAVHEVGHWFGLLHTFHGQSCNPAAGDMVDDTPQQRIAGSGCPIGQDSCPDLPGLDPIHNYMDYSDDSW